MAASAVPLFRSLPILGAAVCVSFRIKSESSRAQEEKGANSKPKFRFVSSCILPTSWVQCKLLSVRPYNHDTSIFEFEVPGGGSLKLPTCACLLLKAPGCEHPWNGGGDAIRPYTPISSEEVEGKFQLLIKRYQEWGTKPTANEGYALHESYRPAGAVSNYLFSLTPGVDSAYFCHRAQNLKLQYPFNGVQTITMIAVGVGIAPMIQALEKILETPGDSTKVVLLYGNRSIRDILMKEKLDDWSIRYPERFKVVFAVGSRWANVQVGALNKLKEAGLAVTIEQLTEPPTPDGFNDLVLIGNQAKEVGWVDEEIIKAYGFGPSPNSKVFVCGLPGVYNKLCGARTNPQLAEDSALFRLGFRTENIVKF